MTLRRLESRMAFSESLERFDHFPVLAELELSAGESEQQIANCTQGAWECRQGPAARAHAVRSPCVRVASFGEAPLGEILPGELHRVLCGAHHGKITGRL